MSLRSLALAPTLVLVAVASAAAQELPTARIDSVFAQFNRSDRPGCTVAVFKDGEVAYANGYGMANLEYGIALQPRSVFHVASISKQFAAFAVELLVSDGLVSWDDPIQKYVPEIPEYEHPVTLRHLVHHTSGIRDQWSLLLMAGWRWQADLVTQANAIEVMSRQTALNFDPGEEYLYSNSGFTLLAAVVERVSNQTLKEFSQDRIFGPLGMTSTHFHDDHETIVPDRAYGYRNWPQEGWKISIPDFAIVGASALFTTVEDMAKWDASLRDQTLGDAALYDRFFEVGVLNDGEELNYAHGITVSPYRGQMRVGHGGADAGYRTNYSSYPELGYGFVSFCNFAAADPGLYVREVTDIVLEDVLDPVIEEETSEPEIDADRWAEAFASLAGFYRDPLNDRPIHVWLHEGRARIQQGFGAAGGGSAIVPVNEQEFRIGDDGPTIRRVDSGLELDGVRYDYIGDRVTDFEAADYAGVYWSEELGTEYRFSEGEGPRNLAMTHRKQWPATFRPIFEDGFRRGGDWIVFERDEAGRVSGFSWSSGRVRKVSFERRE